MGTENPSGDARGMYAWELPPLFFFYVKRRKKICF